MTTPLEDEQRAQARALRRETGAQFARDLGTNAVGMGSAIGSTLANMGGQALAGWQALPAWLQAPNDMDAQADAITSAQEQLQVSPNQRGQEYLESAGKGLQWLKAQALRAPGAQRVQAGWDKLVAASPLAATAIVTGAEFIEPTKGKAGKVLKAADEAAETAAEVWRAKNLTPQQRAIESNLINKIGNDEGAALAQYAAHPESKGGKLLNTDIARELSDDYLSDRTQSAAVHEPASQFITKTYDKMLANPPGPGEENIVMFSAGGTGAGKSTGLELLGDEVARSKIIYDTNMSSLDSSVAKIEKALNAGNDVRIVYTWRDPVEALVNGALPRAMRQEAQFGSGRTVPLEEHVKTHVGAAKVIRELAEKYGGDERVNIQVIDNSRGKGNAGFGDVVNIPEIDYNQLLEGARNALETSYANGDISESVYRGFKGSDDGARKAARSTIEEGGAADYRQPEQAGGGKARKVAVGNLWENVTDPKQALAMALRGEHIKHSPSGIVGAPEGVMSMEDVERLRAAADERVAAGEAGMDWYDRARREAQALAPDDPAMQSLFARGGAIYSPQAMPPAEVAAFAKQHNAKMLTGEDIVPRTRAQSRALARAYGPGDELHPENLQLGKKTGPYAEAKDPTVDESSLYKTANDIWHGRVMGYGEDFNRGFTPQEHGYLTGENLLLAERAKERDAAAGIEREAQWNPRSAQAATWTAQREQKMLAEALKRGDEDTPELRESISRRARAGIPEAVDQNLAFINKEERPGSMTGEDPRAGDYGTSRELIPNRDPIIDVLRMYQRDTVPTEGFYTNQQGIVERNPAGATPVLVGKNAGKNPSTPAAEMAALEQAAHQHAFTRAQDSVGITRFHPESEQKVADLNALLLERSDPEQIAAMERAAQEIGASPIDTGDRTLLTMFGDQGPKAGTTKAMVDALRRHGVEGKAARGTVEANLVESKMPPEEGTGQATEHYLAESARREQLIPNLEARTAQATAEDAAAVQAMREAAATATGGKLRSDLTRALKILSEGGLPALRQYVAKYGSAGLPAVVMALLLQGQDEQSEPAA